MAKLTVQVDGHDEPIDVELDLATLSMQEAKRFHAELGTDRFVSVMRDGLTILPDVLAAFIYAKVATVVPDLTPDDFDMPFLEAVTAAAGEGDEGKATSGS